MMLSVAIATADGSPRHCVLLNDSDAVSVNVFVSDNDSLSDRVTTADCVALYDTVADIEGVSDFDMDGVLDELGERVFGRVCVFVNVQRWYVKVGVADRVGVRVIDCDVLVAADNVSVTEVEARNDADTESDRCDIEADCESVSGAVTDGDAGTEADVLGSSLLDGVGPLCDPLSDTDVDTLTDMLSEADRGSEGVRDGEIGVAEGVFFDRVPVRVGVGGSVEEPVREVVAVRETDTDSGTDLLGVSGADGV